MKKLILALTFLPLALNAQDTAKEEEAPFEGWMISDCQKYALQELTKGVNGQLKGAAASVYENTKTIYIAQQKWLQNLPDTVNGMEIKYVNLEENAKMLANEVKKNNAAVFYIGAFDMNAKMCDMWIFPIDIKKKKVQYGTTAYKMNFFFNYDPPKYEYRGTDAVVLQ